MNLPQKFSFQARFDTDRVALFFHRNVDFFRQPPQLCLFRALWGGTRPTSLRETRRGGLRCLIAFRRSDGAYRAGQRAAEAPPEE